jgi:long-chain acyl-CoA synthetase
VTSAVMQDRAAIEAETADMTLCDLLRATAESYGDRPAYSDREGGPDWETLTWHEFRDAVLRLAAGFVKLGLQPGERVALMLPNRVQHVLADQAVVHAGGVPVTFYATLSADQFK